MNKATYHQKALQYLYYHWKQENLPDAQIQYHQSTPTLTELQAIQTTLDPRSHPPTTAHRLLVTYRDRTLSLSALGGVLTVTLTAKDNVPPGSVTALPPGSVTALPNHLYPDLDTTLTDVLLHLSLTGVASPLPFVRYRILLTRADRQDEALTLAGFHD